MTPAVPPRVVIGIPTFNRAVGLERALRSALEQDYPNLVVHVSDNASTDGTQALCERIVASDPRVVYERQGQNIGSTRNFLHVFHRAQGDMFLWLADDDWLDAGYVTAGVEALSRDRGAVVAAGVASYHGEDGAPSHRGRPVLCAGSNPMGRVFDYYRQVDDNAVFYGVMRLAEARRACLRNVMGGDWHFIAELAFQGRLLLFQGPQLHRSLGGASHDKARMVRVLGLPSWQARLPVTLPLALAAARALREGEPYAGLSPTRRRLASLALLFWLAGLKPVQALLRRPLAL